ncbi:MAG: IS66 family transposase [Spirulina sp. SIO3F2]|nr:IS66 family transposase [Spirulina sp. SIO3F2]
MRRNPRSETRSLSKLRRRVRRKRQIPPEASGKRTAVNRSQNHQYRLHQLKCSNCGEATKAELPKGVSSLGYGERLSATIGLLSSPPYRQSYRQVCRMMSEVFNIEISRGSVGRLRAELLKAISDPVAAAKDYVQSQPIINSDETSFSQGNRDGSNPHSRQGWLWVLLSPLVSFFEVTLNRSQQTAQDLMGEDYSGIVISDRYSAYSWIPLEQRQLCWAHLKRDLTAIAERTGVAHEIGSALLARQRRLFRWWYRLREGSLSRELFLEAVESLRASFKQILEEAAALPISPQEKTPLAKTVRTCRQLLKVEPALWTFVYTSGVEPTNNAAERALRPAVIWRRTSFGSQSQQGSRFVAAMLTVTASLQAQGRPALDWLSQAFLAVRSGSLAPSLIPDPSFPCSHYSR